MVHSDTAVEASTVVVMMLMERWRHPAVHHALLPTDPPPLPQKSQQVLREHGVAIAPAFATFDPQQHTLAVNIGDL